MLEKLKTKLASRKFILALLASISGIATAFSGYGGDIGLICGIVLAVISVATYIVTEGKIDAAGVTLTAEAIQKIITLVNEATEESENEDKTEDTSDSTTTETTSE